MREIILDTETTGLSWNRGHRIIELCCLEVVNYVPGEVRSMRFDPQRDIDPDATKVHGITREMLAGKPLFGDVIDRIIDFLGDAPLIAHSAPFDAGFMAAEFERADYIPIHPSRWVCTLALARRKRPGKKNSLDAICADLKISRPALHSAKADVMALARVYEHLADRRQPSLELEQLEKVEELVGARPVRLPTRITGAEAAAHGAMVEVMGPDAIWRKQ